MSTTKDAKQVYFHNVYVLVLCGIRGRKVSVGEGGGGGGGEERGPADGYLLPPP